jgi:hypothetical protein
MNKTALCVATLFLALSAQPYGKAQQLNLPQTAQKSAPAANGAITGRVLDEAGELVPDAQVSLLVSGGSNTTPRTATSDDEGKFSFNDLPPRQYRLSARAPGYVQPRTLGQSYRIGDTVTLTLAKGGVITGRITNELGEPVVAVRVSAQPVRDAAGNPLQGAIGFYAQQTDDRGVYRLYGLAAGSYLVLANAPDTQFSPLTAYENETPTYYPSATRDAAQEVTVRLGEETRNIDIRYRGERGHLVSGNITGAVEAGDSANRFVAVSLKPVASLASYSSATVRPQATGYGFELVAIPNGEYELTARRYEAQATVAASAPRRISVKGADVIGVTLNLLPLGLLTGRIVLASPAAEDKCAETIPFAWEEASLWAQRAEPGRGEEGQVESGLTPARLTIEGAFVIYGLAAGVHRPSITTQNSHWYLRKVTLVKEPTAPPARNAPVGETDLSRTGIALKPGEKLTGLIITLAPGAATLQGRLVSAVEGKLPELVRVYLVPAEAAAADDVLRYAETLVNQEGKFTFTRLAPGRYRLFAEAILPDEARARRARLAAWDQLERARLRRAAEATQSEIELKACELVKDYVLPFVAKQ